MHYPKDRFHNFEVLFSQKKIWIFKITDAVVTSFHVITTCYNNWFSAEYYRYTTIYFSNMNWSRSLVLITDSTSWHFDQSILIISNNYLPDLSDYFWKIRQNLFFEVFFLFHLIFWSCNSDTFYQLLTMPNRQSVSRFFVWFHLHNFHFHPTPY